MPLPIDDSSRRNPSPARGVRDYSSPTTEDGVPFYRGRTRQMLDYDRGWPPLVQSRSSLIACPFVRLRAAVAQACEQNRWRCPARRCFALKFAGWYDDPHSSQRRVRARPFRAKPTVQDGTALRTARLRRFVSGPEGGAANDASPGVDFATWRISALNSVTPFLCPLARHSARLPTKSPTSAAGLSWRGEICVANDAPQINL
jgi:hypothetical protein